MQQRSYNADQISAVRVASPPAGKTGVDIVLKSDPVASAVDDEVLARVTLLWDEGKAPPVGRDIALSEGVVVAVGRIGCFCGGKDGAFAEPVASGKVRFHVIDDKTVRGDFDLSFKGQVALTSGGILYDDDTLKVRAANFEMKR